MASNYTVVNSRFTPFTFEEILKPMAIAQGEYDKLESQYSDLDTKAGVMENLLNEFIDPESYKLYSKYNKDLQDLGNAFLSEGVTPKVRGALRRMRGRYSKEIQPIEEAYKQREIDRDIRRKDPSDSKLYEFNPFTASVDEYLNGRRPSGAVVDTDKLYSMGANAATSFTSRNKKITPGKAFGDQYFTMITEQGLSERDAIEYMKDTNPEFKNMIEGIKKSAHVDKLLAEDQAIAESKIIEGFKSQLMYDKSYQFQADRGWKPPIEAIIERVKLRQLLGDDPSTPEERFFDYTGQEVAMDENSPLKQLNNDLDILLEIKDARKHGIDLASESSSPEIVMPSTLGKPSVQFTLPAGNKFSKYRGYTDKQIDKEIKEISNKIFKSTNVNKFATLLLEDPESLLNYMSNNLGIEDVEGNLISSNIKHTSSQKAPDREVYGKLMTSKNTKVKYNPVTMIARLSNPQLGSFDISLVSAFHDIDIPVPTADGGITIVPGDEYLLGLSQDFLQSYDKNSKSPVEENIKLRKGLNRFFGILGEYNYILRNKDIEKSAAKAESDSINILKNILQSLPKDSEEYKTIINYIKNGR